MATVIDLHNREVFGHPMAEIDERLVGGVRPSRTRASDRNARRLVATGAGELSVVQKEDVPAPRDPCVAH